ncbi:M56 family metallopeptidase [uncultured Hymenobacter sp.]|uniref:M56 family metallopeptidase n=1 Tax=uncultured Hymenobacter sp. TaxID=170016 RepID=UPI0035CBAF7F
MSAALLYLLQANLILLLFAAGWLLLRRLTFFGLNRAYLLLALGVAALGPALPVVPAWWAPTQALAPVLAGRWLAAPAAVPAAAAATGFDWQTGLLVLYATGATALLARLLLQGLALRRLHRASRPAAHHGLAYREVSLATGPCSFWQAIYLNPNGLTPTELAAVLRHEQAHVRQWHTLDVLLSQLLSCLAWPNPAAWGLRRAVLTNLEYLADRHALRGGALSRRAYQLSLLRLAQAGAVPALTTSFLFSPLKTRILMLNQPPTPTGQAARYLLLAPLLALTLGMSTVLAPSAQAQTDAKAYYLDGQLSNKATVGQLNPLSIARIEVFRGDTARQLFHEGGKTAVITTVQNENSAAVRELAARIARFGAAPTPASAANATPISALPPAALAYITKNYPGHRLIGVTQMTLADQGPQYNAEIAIGRRPKHVLFDAQGQFVKEQ